MREAAKFGAETTASEVAEGIDLGGKVALDTGGVGGRGQWGGRASWQERRQHEKGLLGSYLQIDFGRIGPKGLWGVGGASGPVIRRALFDHVREPGAGPRSRSATADGPCRIRQL